MKKLVITLMLVSPFSFADWGDVYYCQMTTHSTTTLEGVRTDRKPKKFQFKLDKTKKAMVFDQGGAFKTYQGEGVLKTRKGAAWPSKESWYADGMLNFVSSYFDRGKFLYSITSSVGITSISADCDKF